MKQLNLFLVVFLSAMSAQASFISGKYIGNGASSKTVSGLGFKPEVVLVKSGSSHDAWIATSTMSSGYAKLLTGNDAPATGYISALNSDGFTVGSSTSSNSNGVTYYFTAWDDADGSITVGSFTPVNCGASTVWATATWYSPGTLVTYGSNTYHANTGHTSSSSNRPDMNDGSWNNLGACSSFNVNVSVGYRPEMLWVLGEGISNQWDEVSPGQFTFDNSNSSSMAHFTQGSMVPNEQKIISDLNATGFTTRAVSNRGTHDGPANGVKYNYVTFKASSTVTTNIYTGVGSNNTSVTTTITPYFLMVKDFNGGQNTWFKNTAMGTDTSYKFTGPASTSDIKKFTATGFTLGTGGETNGSGNTFDYFLMGGGSTLPVQLTFFKGAQENRMVKLKWQTASEISAEFFLVERSSNGEEFEYVGLLNAAGNSNDLKDYEFVDSLPHNGANYYRLKQFDNNGDYELFHTICINFSMDLLLSFKAFPNVIYDRLELFFDAEDSGQYHLQVINGLGQVVGSCSYLSTSGWNKMTLPFSDYSNGTYIIRLVSAKGKVGQVTVFKGM